MDNVRPLRPKKPAGKPRSRNPVRRRVVTGIVVAVVVLVLAFGSRVLGMYVDWLWFGEVGFREVFWTRLWAQVLVGLAAFAAFFVIIWANVELARRLAPDFRADVDGTLLEPRSPAVRRWVGIGGAAVCLIVAAMAGVAASGAWPRVLLFLNQVPWGTEDAQFGRDISFYVFSVPFWQTVLSFALAALIASMVLAAIVHLIMGGIEFKQKSARVAADGGAGPSPFARAQQAAPQIPQVDIKLGGRAVAHLSALLAAVFVVVGIGQLFKAWDLLYSTAGAIYGAANTDVVIRLPLTRVTMVIAFILAAVLVWNVWRRHQWWPLTIAVWVVALIVLRGIVPAVYQSLVVNPNQLSKEREYIARNLEATRVAFDLDRITTERLDMETAITPQVLQDNEITLRNTRLWDPSTLTTSYRQIQELRPYYSFRDSDVDRYTVDGVYRQTMLSARELNTDGLPPQAQTWVNRHITYTHGFGVSVSAVNQVTFDGSPDFLVKDVPPRGVADLEVKEPRIYFGEVGTEYTLVKTKEQEFDYPGSGGEDVYREYTGTGGIPISPLATRLAFAVRFQTIKFFTTDVFRDDSRIIIRNNIIDRVTQIAPFLRLDGDPYMVISDGRLFWVIDAYTQTMRYPYSTPEGGASYIRNSVKIVVDAYNGGVRFYAFDEEDPILQAYRGIFPDLFTPAAEMPQALLEHVRYPEDLFTIQAATWSTYHVNDPEVLYNKGDQWAIPEGVSLSAGTLMDPYYVIMKLPGQEREEFLMIIPFVPNGRPNMISWLAARSDGDGHGTMLNYQFSTGSSVYGPSQVDAAINQDPVISAQRSLWDRQGSRVILGNLLVIPIEDSLIYVQPLYLEAQQTRLPQLKRVIVFYRRAGAEGGEANDVQVVVMEPTLSEALRSAFGAGLEALAEDEGQPQPGDGTGGATDGDGTGGQAGGSVGAQARELIARANQEFAAAQEALKAGDFAEYGRRIEALEQALTDLQRLQQ